MKKRIALETITTLLAVYLTLTPESSFAFDLCRKLFSSSSVQYSSENSTQSVVQNHESDLISLIEKYSRRLGPFSDPFAMVWNPEQGDRIFHRLSLRLQNGHWVTSPLGLVNQELKKIYTGKGAYNKTLLNWLIQVATESLNQPPMNKNEVSRTDLQSNLLALKYAVEYLRRFKEPEIIVDRDGQERESTPPSKKEPPSREQISQKELEESPAEYPDLPKEYKPSTNETRNLTNGKQKRHRVAEVNFSTPFFAQRYFANIVRGTSLPFQEAILPTTPIQPPQSKGMSTTTHTEMIVRTFGKNKVDLFIPPGFKPLLPTDPRVSILHLETGGYRLELKEDLPEVHIPLIEDINITMMPHLREVYTRPVGFKKTEWPDQIQANVLRHYTELDGKTHPLQISQAIADHITTEYLYSVGSRSETDPIDALKAGAFQCDMAAYSMVGLLRDVYQIPSRVVGGFRAKKYQNGKDGKSYLVVPGEAHAWVEVFHDGKWHLFDPTPIKKDKKDNHQSDSEYSDHALENTPKPENEQQPESGRQQDDKQPPSQSQGEGADQKDEQQDHLSRLTEDTARRVKEKTTKAEPSEEQKHEKENEDLEGEDQLTSKELADQLELGSLELEPHLDRNALLERAVRVVLQNVLNPTQRGSDIQNRLNQISYLMRRFGSLNVKQIYQNALSAHSNEHPDIKNWIEGLARMLSEQDVNKTYQEIHKIWLALECYSKVLDLNGRIPPPRELIATLEQIQGKLNELAHPDSQDIGLVQDLVKGLPRVARQLLKQLFDLSQVGPNHQTREVAQRLKRGELNDLRLMSILGPLSEFILSSTPRPENTEIRIWQRDTRRPTGRDLLPLQRPTNIARTLLGRPEKSLEENIRDGTAFVPTKRQRIQIPLGYGKEEAERITIVLYDTSGSMNGNPGRFQAGLISAFTARALSDVSRSGRHRHKVVLVPFDEKPGEPVPVTNTAEALDIIRNYQKKLKNTGGNTNIQNALLQAMSLIADAEGRAGEPLAAANIVLMTDGQAQIDAAQLLQARKAIDRQTPLQTMFIAINATNEELMHFAMDSQSIGAEKGFYREFTEEHIKDILNETDHIDLNGRNDFYTDLDAKDIPQEVHQLLDESLRLATELSDQIYYGSQYTPAREHLDELEKLRWRDVTQVDRPLESWLIKVRRLVLHPVFQDKRLLEKVVDDLLIHFETLTGVKMDSLSDHEQEQLRHLIRYAANLEEGLW